MSEKPTEKLQVTFFSKSIITCPACQTKFQKEELQTGRGRLNAGDLTIELRRMYIPTQKYRIINPMIYPIVVCPSCLFAGLLSDLKKVIPAMVPEIQEEEDNRDKLLTDIFGEKLDFTVYRDTVEGLAAYILAFASTVHLPKESSPTARRGLYALRAAWLADDLYKKDKIDHFKELRDSLYYQAYVNYSACLTKQFAHEEPFDGFVWMGPDVDTNFGYDGLLYMIAYLSIKHINLLTPEEQIIKIGNVKRVLSRIFGVGKSTRDKPQVLVFNSKNLYTDASKLLDKLANSGFNTSVADDIENQEDEES